VLLVVEGEAAVAVADHDTHAGGDPGVFVQACVGYRLARGDHGELGEAVHQPAHGDTEPSRQVGPDGVGEIAVQAR
jgi:hypothetical protein